MTTTHNYLRKDGEPPKGVHASRVVRSRLPLTDIHRNRQSNSPHIVMAGNEAILVIDRRMIPMRIITSIVEDKTDAGFSLIYMSREAGVRNGVDRETQRATEGPLFARVPFPIDQIGHAFLPFDVYADMVYGSDEPDEPTEPAAATRGPANGR